MLSVDLFGEEKEVNVREEVRKCVTLLRSILVIYAIRLTNE